MRFLGAAPSNPSDLVTKAYADSLGGGGSGASGMLAPVQHVTDGTETYTISGGSVTSIQQGTGGVQIQWLNVSVGDRILVVCAPASSGSGVGYTYTNNPANGIYVVNSLSGSIAVSRSTDFSGAVSPHGLSVYMENTSCGWGARSIYSVKSPFGSAAFTWGSTGLQFDFTAGANLNVQTAYVAGDGRIGWWNNTPGINTYLNVNSGATTGSTQNLYLPGVTTGTLLARVVVSVTSVLTFGNAPGTEYVYLLKTGAVPTLPTAVGNTASYRVKNTTAAAITLLSAGGTIDGSTSISLRPNVSVDIVSDGTNYFVI